MGQLYVPQQPMTMVPRRFPMVRSRRRKIFAQHDFPDTTGILNYYGAGGTDQLEVDTTHCRIGSAAIKMPIPSGKDPVQTQTRYYNTNQWTSFDASAGYEIEVSWWTPPTNSPTGDIYAGLLATHSSKFAIQKIAGGGLHTSPGWHRQRFNSFASTGAGWDPATITGWNVQFTGSEGQYIVLDQISVLKRIGEKPTLIWRNDDASSTVKSMCNYLEKYGYYMTIGVIGSVVGTAGYCTLAELRDLSDRGHLIVSHTWSHQDWTTLTVTQCVDEVRRNYEWLNRNHLGRGSNILISPYYWQAPPGQVAETMGRCLGMCDVLLTTRRKHAGYPESGNILNYGLPGGDMDDLRIIPLLASDATATAAYIENTLAPLRGPRVLLYHHLDAGGITTANFRAAVDKAAELDAAETIDVLTLDEYLFRAAIEEY